VMLGPLTGCYCYQFWPNEVNEELVGLHGYRQYRVELIIALVMLLLFLIMTVVVLLAT
jgi:hypothetical protein